MKVRDAIKLIEDDGWRLVRTRGRPPPVQARDETGPRDDSRQTEQGLAPRLAAKHSETGGTGRIVISVNGHGYLIVIERGEGNYGAWAPDLPGCVAVGDTIEECEREMREAIAFHIEGLREEGEPVPEPAAVAAAVVNVT
jgi:predicted RNase H-like HicB family nuclease